QRKSGLPIVFLLVDDTVKPDVAAAQRCQRGVPYLHTVALAAEFGLDDVEPDESERIAILHRGDRRDRLAFEQPDEEAAVIRRVEAARVVPTGIPSLRSGPIDGDVDFAERHRSDS